MKICCISYSEQLMKKTNSTFPSLAPQIERTINDVMAGKTDYAEIRKRDNLVSYYPIVVSKGKSVVWYDDQYIFLYFGD